MALYWYGSEPPTLDLWSQVSAYIVLALYSYGPVLLWLGAADAGPVVAGGWAHVAGALGVHRSQACV